MVFKRHPLSEYGHLPKEKATEKAVEPSLEEKQRRSRRQQGRQWRLFHMTRRARELHASIPEIGEDPVLEGLRTEKKYDMAPGDEGLRSESTKEGLWYEPQKMDEVVKDRKWEWTPYEES